MYFPIDIADHNNNVYQSVINQIAKRNEEG